MVPCMDQSSNQSGGFGTLASELFVCRVSLIALSTARNYCHPDLFADSFCFDARSDIKRVIAHASEYQLCITHNFIPAFCARLCHPFSYPFFRPLLLTPPSDNRPDPQFIAHTKRLHSKYPKFLSHVFHVAMDGNQDDRLSSPYILLSRTLPPSSPTHVNIP